jgi:hypothetical protein
MKQIDEIVTDINKKNKKAVQAENADDYRNDGDGNHVSQTAGTLNAAFELGTAR